MKRLRHKCARSFFSFHLFALATVALCLSALTEKASARELYGIFPTLGSTVAGLPASTTTTGVNAASIGPDNTIYAIVGLQGDDVDGSNDRAVIRIVPGEDAELIIREGDKIGDKVIWQINYGEGGVFADKQGNVMFEAYIPRGVFGKRVLVHGKAGNLRIIAGETLPAPGGGGKLEDLSQPRMNKKGMIAFQGYHPNGGNTSQVNIFFGGPATLRKHLQSSVHYPNLILGEPDDPNVTIENFGTGIYINDDGALLVPVRLTYRAEDDTVEPPIPGINSQNDNQVLLFKDREVTPILREGMAAPDLPGFTINNINLRPESFANKNWMVILADLRDSSNQYAGRALFAGQSASMQLVMRTGVMLPGSGAPTASRISGAAICDTGRVIVAADLTDGREGIWSWKPKNESLEAVIIEGDPAPDYGSATIDSVHGAVLGSTGRLALGMSMSSIFGGGVWAENEVGNLEIISGPGMMAKNPRGGADILINGAGLPANSLDNITGGSDGLPAFINGDDNILSRCNSSIGQILALDFERSPAIEMHRLEAPAVSNLGDGLTNIHSPLEPVDDAKILGAQPIIHGGLVADGVTPLLFSVQPSILDLSAGTNFEITAEIVTGGTVGGVVDLDSRIQFLRNGNWQQSGNILSADSDQPQMFFALRPIASDDVIFNPPENELFCQIRLLEPGGGEELKSFDFRIRKPPVTLIHGYNTTGEWGPNMYTQLARTRPRIGTVIADKFVPDEDENFVIKILYGQEQAEGTVFPWLYQISSDLETALLGNTVLDFPTLAKMLETKLDNSLTPLKSNWAFTRHDTVAHSQGGILTRMLASKAGPGIRPFQSKENFHRGRFHRSITIGSPHNGSRLVRYLMALAEANSNNTLHFPEDVTFGGTARIYAQDVWNNPHGYLTQTFFALGIARDKFDPTGVQIKELNKKGGPWTPDTDALFHLVRTTINQGMFPTKELHTEGDHRASLDREGDFGKDVLPFGSDGIVDFKSMGAEGDNDPSGQDNVFNVSLFKEISHSGPAWLFQGEFETPVGQVHSIDVATHVHHALNQDVSGGVEAAHLVFTSFHVPSLLSDIEAEKINAAARSSIVKSGSGITQSSSASGAKKSGKGSASSFAGAANYDLTANALAGLPISGDVQWSYQVFGPTGLTRDGATLSVSGANSELVTVTTDNDVFGDVVIYASYQSTDGTLVFLTPFLAQSVDPTGKTLTSIKIHPDSLTVAKGSRIAPSIEAIYDDGSSFFRFSKTGVSAVSDNPGVVDASDPIAWRTTAFGTANVTVTYRGLMDSAEINVVSRARTAAVPGYQPDGIVETPENWTGNEVDADGSYVGLVNTLGGDTIGLASVRVASSGTMSGTVTFDGLKLRFKGAIGANGSFGIALNDRRSDRSFDLALQLVTTPQGYRLSGTLSEGATVYFIAMDHAGFDRRTDPAPWAGSFTALLPANPLYADGTTHPQGDGWATASMKSDGKMRFVGQLGDTEKLSLAGVVSKDGSWRVYKDLYRSRPKGRIGGTVYFREFADVSDFDGELHWLKPANPKEKLYPEGFAMGASLVGSSLDAPFKGARLLTQLFDRPDNASWILGLGNLPSDPGLKVVTWDARNKILYTPVASEKLRVGVSSRNGAVKGSYTDRLAGLNVKFNGVAFQKQGIVAGAFKGVDQTGYFLMRPEGEPALEISSFAGSVRIANGDASPAPAEGTDFGDAGVDGDGYAQRSFRIANTGTALLFIPQAPNVIGSGFSLVACRTGPLAPGEEMLMTIRFQPPALGEELGVIRIASNDEDDNPFTFGIRANGIAGSLVNDDGVGGNWAGALPPAPSDSPASNPIGLVEAQIASYFGLLQSQAPGGEIPGTFALKLGKGGAFSGKLEMAGVKTNVRGTFLANGSAAVTVTPKGGADDLVFALQLHQVTGSNAYRVHGTLSQGSSVYDIDLARNDFNRKSNLAPQAGSYTMLTLASDDLGVGYPGGESALTVVVGADGKIKAKGVLGDGEKISTSGFLSADSEWPIYKSLYKTKPKGHLAGVLTFRDEVGVSDFDGVLQWLRRPDPKGKIFPYGFKWRTVAIGSAYTSPAGAGELALPGLNLGTDNAVLTLDGDTPHPLPGPFDFTWLENGKTTFTPASGEKISLKIVNRDGSIKGSYRNIDVSIKSFNGVVFQKQAIVSGNFVHEKSSGRISIDAN